MLAIPLPNGEHTVVDEHNFDMLKLYKWFLTKGVYANYVYTNIKRKNVAMSRMITNAKKGYVVDHINGHTLNNTEVNLRVCTSSQNNCNKSALSNNKSGEKGVSWNNRANKWRVVVKINGKQTHVGFFDDLAEAIAASRAALKQNHGEYACFERKEIDYTDFYMAKWHPKSIELFSETQKPKSEGILNLFDLTVSIPTDKGIFTIVDLFDYEIANQYTWYARYNKYTDSYYANSNARDETGKSYTMAMQRLITDAKKGDTVDHANGVTMDNRRINLRVTDRSNNMRNRKVFSNSTSGETGVSFDKSSGKWKAYYSVDGKSKHIGLFGTKEEAIAAREKVVSELYGEFRRVQLKKASCWQR